MISGARSRIPKGNCRGRIESRLSLRGSGSKGIELPQRSCCIVCSSSFAVDDKAVLTHGFIKKTQKTPKKEIQKAKDIREEHLKRQKSKKEGEKNG
ncbi:MAG: hypothetical protein E7200_08125 [Selenomonas ruminantium]|nr:hypothetical protein [Selenomonas ruminantium]